jgi:hypothetical protein
MSACAPNRQEKTPDAKTIDLGDCTNRYDGHDGSERRERLGY